MKCPYCSQEHPANTKLCPETGDKIKMNNVGDLIACNNQQESDLQVYNLLHFLNYQTLTVNNLYS